MGNLDPKWLAVLLVQLGIGGALVWFAPENVEGASTLGIAILGSAAGQTVTGGMKATKE